ncbi:MAG TPA: ArsR family transcriptional regulator [Firmicutes bacterium]|nr:ArsR family transcriptional regulator [Bacillota bacterium]
MADAKSKKLSRIFKVLSVDNRVRMIELLKSRSLCVNALARELNLTPAAVSQHLRVLRDCEIVTAEKKGYYVHYRVNDKVLKNWRKMADELLQRDDG